MSIKISEKYTIFTRIPLVICGGQEVCADRLWAIDLIEHMRYIDDFHVCCPIQHADAVPDGYLPVPGLELSNIVPVREDIGWPSAVLNFIPNFFAVAKAARNTAIAHGSAAGWPFSLAYYLYPLKSWYAFKLIFVMESSFWMLPARGAATLRQMFAHRINSFFVKRMMQQAEARIFTQAAYRDWCFPHSEEECLINEAVWINAEDMVDPSGLKAVLGKRKGPVRLVFPGRLVAEKGVQLVLSSIALVEKHFTKQKKRDVLAIDIVGTGAMEQDIRDFIAKHPGKAVALRLLPPVTYGPAFFELLREYDAGIVANLFDEQPRIIYDLFAQGVPCIAAGTTGVNHIVHQDEDALIFAPDDADGLADRIIYAADNRERLMQMGEAARANVAGKTHHMMHETRAKFLASVIQRVS